MTDDTTHTGKANASPISAARLQAMLLDPDVPEAAMRPYLIEDEVESGAFEPRVRVDPAMLQGTLTESTLAFGTVNGISRFRRKRRYRRMLGGWNGPRIVSEGDSWFQFPFLLTDTIDHLMDDHAILSHGAAGDLLSQMLQQDELMAAVAAENASLVLVSAGGNDLLGASGLTRILEPHAVGMTPADYLGPTFDAFLGGIIVDYRRLVSRVTDAFAGVNVVCHSYDRAVPRNGRWLGQPMARIGIADVASQRAIVSLMVDRFHQGLEELADESVLRGRLHLVDARGTLADGDWHDELHPDDGGYGRVANLFRAAIDRALSAGGARPGAGVERPGAAVEGVANDGSRPNEDELCEVAAAALVLASDQTSEALVREAGRRMQMAELRVAPPLRRDLTAVPTGGVEGIGDAFAKLGRRLLARAEEEAYGLLCGDGEADRADRDAFRTAMGLGPKEFAMFLAGFLTSGTLGLPIGAATVIAGLLIKRFGRGMWEESCEAWSERLGDGGGVEAPAVRRSVDLVPETAKRAVNDPGRALTMLTPARSGEPSSQAPVPDLSPERQADSTGMLEAALYRRMEEMGERAVIGPDSIDRTVAMARSGLAIVGQDGERAQLTRNHGMALEAVVETDGSRPSLLVQDDAVVREGEIGKWKRSLDDFDAAIGRVSRSVGRIDKAGRSQGQKGTGFVIAPGLVLTNRHVLESIAFEVADGNATRWHFPEPTTVDFAREHERDRTRRFAVTGVAYAPPRPVNFMVDFDVLDLAVLRCDPDGTDGDFPEPLELETRQNAYFKDRDVYTLGFPASPGIEPGVPEDDDDAPGAGLEFVRVQQTLFGMRFGVKRFSPGKLLDVPGALPGDDRGWVTNHDATTLGGSSGSCMVDLSEHGARVMGLHFGGQSRRENWAHALAALEEELGLALAGTSIR